MIYAHIRLHNFNPSQNKYRVYAIAIEQGQQKEAFNVFVSWGRSPFYQRQKSTFFGTKKAMLHHLQNILHRRRQHGYKIIEKSGYFPQVKALENLSYGNRVGEQLSLF